MTVLASSAQLRASFIRWALFFVPVVVLLGYISGTAAGSAADNPWFAALTKPALYPPPATFGIVWTILYILMGIAAALVASSWGARFRTAALVAFVVQFVLNLAWSPLFFALHQLDGAFYLILAIDLAVLVTLILFWRVRRVAGMLLLPYLLWVAFATYLSWDIARLNPAADGTEYSGAVQRIEL